MTSDVVEKHIKELRQNKNIVKLGIHFHRKSQNMSEWNLIYELSNTFSDELFNLIDVMSIGGGIPAEYANTNVDVIDVIFKRITEFRTWLHERKVNLIIEPGRYIAAPSVVLKTEIIGIHENNIIVNASVYNSDMDALIVPVKLLIAEEVSKEKGKPYAVKGITPCSMDLFRYRVYLENPRIGDVLTFLNAGAYNFSTDFCDLDVIETEIVD